MMIAHPYMADVTYKGSVYITGEFESKGEYFYKGYTVATDGHKHDFVKMAMVDDTGTFIEAFGERCHIKFMKKFGWGYEDRWDGSIEDSGISDDFFKF